MLLIYKQHVMLSKYRPKFQPKKSSTQFHQQNSKIFYVHLKSRKI